MTAIDRGKLAQQLEVEQRRFVETDVDGHEYIDLCLGDTGAMTRYAPEPVLEAITNRMRSGVTLLRPFHNMALISPYIRESDIDGHTEVFRQAVKSLAR